MHSDTGFFTSLLSDSLSDLVLKSKRDRILALMSRGRCLLTGWLLGSLLSVIAFSIFPRPTASANVAKIKNALLLSADTVAKGLDETPEQRDNILSLIQQLEKKNPTKVPTASSLITARWRLVYTTSESILGKTRPAIFRPTGPIYQFINLAKGTARNQETIRPIPFLPPIQEAIDATIEPESNQRVRVEFQRLELGPLKVKFKSSNYLDTTYLDKDLRISRGGRGNVFVLVRDDE